MQTFGSQDIYSVQKCGLLGEGSLASLSELYLPLIGAKALGLYFALYAEGNHADLVHFGDELRKKSGMTFSDIQASRRPLEAIGLLKTSYEKGSNGRGIFYFQIFAPASPKDFLGDVLLSGTLHSILGEEEYKKVQSRYVLDTTPKGGKDISEKFEAYFQPDYNDPVYLNSQIDAIGDGPKKIETSFDSSIFLSALGNNGFKGNLLSQEELDFCEKMGALYAYPSGTLGEFASDCLHVSSPYGTRLDRQGFLRKCRDGMKVSYLHREGTKSAVHGDSDLAKKIRLMDEVPPAKWLSLKQNNHRPATSDLKILEALTLDIGLSSGACNALVDYILQTNNNVLSKPLAEKIGASLVRANITTSQDAMEYLNSQIREARKKRTPYNKEEEKPQEPAAVRSTDGEETISNEELDALFEKAYQK